MSKPISPLVLIGGGLAAYFLFLKPNSPPAAPVNYIPGTTVPVPGTTSLPATTTTVAYGINSGIKGGNGSFYTCSNYSQLLALFPNLGNPNYQMSAAENQQYLSNYQDLQTGLPSWIGHKQLNGVTPQNIQQAAQTHWTTYGCAEKRIYKPLVPPSTASYIPPPTNTASSGSGSFLSSALSVVGTVLPYAAALLGETEKLNNADLQLLFSGGAILKDILPLYYTSDPQAASIENRLETILKQYV